MNNINFTTLAQSKMVNSEIAEKFTCENMSPKVVSVCLVKS